MTEIYWQGNHLSVETKALDETDWLSLPALVSALEGHLQDLPNGGIGLCMADDLCLPLRPSDLRQEADGPWVALTALAALGISAGNAPTNSVMHLGDTLPDITFTHMDGSRFNLQALPQKPTLLFAWASW